MTTEARAAKLAKENRELRYRLAIHESGMAHLNDIQLKGVLAVVDGEVTAEALKRTAAELYGEAG